MKDQAETREVRIHINRNPYQSPNPTTAAALYELGQIPERQELFREADGNLEDQPIPKSRDAVHLKTDEHFYSEKEFRIFVNTKPRKIVGPEISFEQVLKEAGFTVAAQDLNLYDVEWVHGNEAGTLAPGQTVALKNGMRFDAGKSNRS